MTSHLIKILHVSSTSQAHFREWVNGINSSAFTSLFILYDFEGIWILEEFRTCQERTQIFYEISTKFHKNCFHSTVVCIRNWLAITGHLLANNWWANNTDDLFRPNSRARLTMLSDRLIKPLLTRNAIKILRNVNWDSIITMWYGKVLYQSSKMFRLLNLKSTIHSNSNFFSNIT